MSQLSLRHHLNIYFQNIVEMSSVLHDWFLFPELINYLCCIICLRDFYRI